MKESPYLFVSGRKVVVGEGGDDFREHDLDVVPEIPPEIFAQACECGLQARIHDYLELAREAFRTHPVERCIPRLGAHRAHGRSRPGGGLERLFGGGFGSARLAKTRSGQRRTIGRRDRRPGYRDSARYDHMFEIVESLMQRGVGAAAGVVIAVAGVVVHVASEAAR